MLIRPVIYDPIRSVIRNPLGASIGFYVGQLFANGEQGAWYDPSDFSTLFQDAAGTIPVTAPGQPVGRMLDKSGRGNHATQATAAARPVLQQDVNGKYYLAADGIDDSMVLPVGAISTAFSVVAGVEWATVAGSQKVLGVMAANWARGVLYVRSSSPRYGFGGFFDSTAGSTINFTVAAAERVVLSGIATKSASQNSYRNGVAGTPGAAGAINIAAQNWDIFGTNSGTFSPFSGRLYGIVLVGKELTSSERAATERYIANKSGVTLP